MKINQAIFMLTALFVSVAHAEEIVYKDIPVVNARQTSASVSEVKLLSARTIVELTERKNFENRSVEITLGITAQASACEDMVGIQALTPQSSLDSALNPSDFYYRVNTVWREGCITGASGEPQNLKLVLTYSVDQRRATEAGKPWPAPRFMANSNVRHLSFDAGMMGGYNRWQLFKLDYLDLENAKFDLVKTYSYVQGQVLDSP